jgi:hypothetical protein
MKPKRDPLEKERFMSGVRQKWTAVLLIYSFIVMTVQILFKIDPTPYMNFSLTIGSLFILGGSVDSYMKINAARSLKERELEPTQDKEL